MSLFRDFKSLIGLGPSKEEQQQELERLKQQLNIGTPVEKIQTEINYTKLSYKLKLIPEQTYQQELDRLNEKLKAAIEQGTPSIFEGWDPAAAADTVTKKASPPRSPEEIKNQQTVTDKIFLLGGNKKSKRTKSKRTKSKRTKSKRTKSKRTKSKKSKKSKRTKSKKSKKSKRTKSKRTKSTKGK
jgi:hypothetical protein